MAVRAVAGEWGCELARLDAGALYDRPSCGPKSISEIAQPPAHTVVSQYRTKSFNRKIPSPWTRPDIGERLLGLIRVIQSGAAEPAQAFCDPPHIEWYRELRCHLLQQFLKAQLLAGLDRDDGIVGIDEQP
jgi:hypothetical protein